MNAYELRISARPIEIYQFIYFFHFLPEPLSVNITPQKVIGSSLLDPTKSVQFVCTVNGHPINRIMWYKNGQPLVQLSGRVRVQSLLYKQVLTLSPLSKDDQGMYQCFGTNDWDIGHDNTQLLLGGIHLLMPNNN